MSDGGRSDPGTVIAFRQAGRLERLCIALAWTLFATGVSALPYIVAPLPPSERVRLVQSIHLGAVAFGVAAVLGWRLRPRGRMIALELRAGEALLRRSPFAPRARRVRYGDIHSLALVWPSRWRCLFVGVGSRIPFVYKPRWFAEPDALERIEQALRGGIATLPDAAERLVGIDRRGRVAESIRAHRPRLTSAFAGLLSAIFLFQWRSGSLDDPVELWRQGANTWWLMGDGGGYRLFTGVFLHGSLPHFAANMLSFVMLGLQMEGLLGSWRFCWLALGGALGGSILTGFVNSRPSVGFSLAIFALVGALTVLNFTRRSDLPPPVRVPIALALMLSSLQLMLELWMPSIDHLGHWGGFVSGALLCLLLLPGLDLTRPETRPSAGLRGCVIALVAVYLVALGCSAAYVVRGDQASLLRLAARSLDHPRFPPQVIALLAWRFDALPDASPEELERLRRALGTVVAGEPDGSVYLDALAMLEHRFGRLERALELERRASWFEPDSYFASRLARYEGERLRLQGDAGPEARPPVPVLRLDRGAGPGEGASLVVELGRERPDGLQLDALLEADGEVIGLLRIVFGPTSRLRVSVERLTPEVRAALERAVIRVADVRDGGAGVAPTAQYWHYWTLDPGFASLPARDEPTSAVR